ncbi:methyltransferase family protein [Streptosporangium subroseum]|uniref:methyltransferase family protein n=1 Tax=Streptosporangium subroseum TaxID=106412 RepID=UPI00308FE8EF|nr:isoprenylcysteine carboxylmethyltransferase family protein [Streptosporangium subroseum]
MSPTSFALLIFTLWLGCGIAVRIWLRRRRRHDPSPPPVTDRSGPRQWWGLVQAAWGVLGLAAPLATLGGLDPIVRLDRPEITAAGVALAFLGCLGTLAAQLAMGTSWRVGVNTGERPALVTRGPFRLVRNPIFTLMIAAAAGLVVLVPNVIALAGFAALLTAIHLQVRRVEEPYLQRVHYPSYQHYAGQVGRFLPGIGRLRIPRPDGRQ